MSRNEQTRQGWPGRSIDMLAIDHRASFRRDLAAAGVDDSPETVAKLKDLVWRAAEKAIDRLPETAAPAILIDRAHRSVIEQAQGSDVAVALALEASGQATIAPEATPAELTEDLQRLSCGWGKVLVRWRPDDPVDQQQAQAATLRRLGDLVKSEGLDYLVEVLVSSSGEQSSRCLGDTQHDSIEQMLTAGVFADLWKIEGHDDTVAARRLADLVASANDDASIVVLGGGRRLDDLAPLFAGGRAIDRFNGYAIGRTLWWDPLVSVADGRLTDDDATTTICENYVQVSEVFAAGKRSP